MLNINEKYLKDLILDVENFPKEGITFKDISLLLAQPKAIELVVDSIYQKIMHRDFDLIIGLDARGFIIGSILANELGVGFAMARKKGKAPEHYIYREYKTEYSTDTMGLSKELIKDGVRVHIHDDLLATGGSVGNIVNLVGELGGVVDSTSFIIELEDLNGKDKLKEIFNHSVLKY